LEYWGADCCEWVTSAQASDAIAFETLGGDAAGEDTVEYTPPAMPPAHGKEYFNVLKFYSLSPQVVGSILADLDYSGAAAAAEVRGTATGHGDSRQQEDAGCDRGAEEGPGRERGSGRDARGTGGVVAGPELPFIPDEDEDRLISAVSKAESVLLVGRSGTGKTSIAIGRMFAMYSQWVQALQGGGLHAGHGHQQAQMPAGIGGGDALRLDDVLAVAATDETLQYHQLFLTASRVLRHQVCACCVGV